MRYLDWTLGAGLEGTLERAAQRKEIAPSAVQQFRFTASVFVRAVRAAGALPVLVTQARLVSPSNSESERERIAYGYVRLNQDDLIHAFELTDQALASVARAEEAVLIDTSAEMTGVPEFFADQVHLSKAGSERLATIVANKIEPLLERR
jgi:lysophospholipase L1-like esterase